MAFLPLLCLLFLICPHASYGAELISTTCGISENPSQASMLCPVERIFFSNNYETAGAVSSPEMMMAIAPRGGIPPPPLNTVRPSRAKTVQAMHHEYLNSTQLSPEEQSSAIALYSVLPPFRNAQPFDLFLLAEVASNYLDHLIDPEAAGRDPGPFDPAAVIEQVLQDPLLEIRCPLHEIAKLLQIPRHPCSSVKDILFKGKLYDPLPPFYINPSDAT